VPHSAESTRKFGLEFYFELHRFLSSNLIEYLREFESICKTVLAHESVDPGVKFNEKTVGQKSRDTVPLIFHNKNYFSVLQNFHFISRNFGIILQIRSKNIFFGNRSIWGSKNP
jgi:hypothetical protein